MGAEVPPPTSPKDRKSHQALEPPTYEHVQTQRAASGPIDERGQEHHHSLENEKGKKWLSMFVKSRASSAESLPVFFEGDAIGGRVEVDLNKPEGSKGVSIVVSTSLF